jgi:hypothetical protein
MKTMIFVRLSALGWHLVLLGIVNSRAEIPHKAGGPPSCPSDPLALQQFHIEGAICKPLHRGPISRPCSHREPVLIGVPLELLAKPDLMD